MKVRYIIDSCSRKKGDVIDIDGVIALTLIRNKVCEIVTDNIPTPKVETKTEEKKIEDSIDKVESSIEVPMIEKVKVPIKAKIEKRKPKLRLK